MTPIAKLTRLGVQAWTTLSSTGSRLLRIPLDQDLLPGSAHPVGASRTAVRSRSAGSLREHIGPEQRGNYMERMLFKVSAPDDDAGPSQPHKPKGPLLSGSEAAQLKPPPEDKTDGSRDGPSSRKSRQTAMADAGSTSPATEPTKQFDDGTPPSQYRTAPQEIVITGPIPPSLHLQPDSEQARAPRSARHIQKLAFNRMESDVVRDFAFVPGRHYPEPPVAVVHRGTHAFTAKHTLSIYEHPSQLRSPPLPVKTGIRCMAVTRHGWQGKVALALVTGVVEVWQLQTLTRKAREVPKLKASNVVSLAFPPSKKDWLLILSTDYLRCWKMSDKSRAVASLNAGPWMCTRMEFSSDGNRVGVLSAKKGVIVFQYNAAEDCWDRLKRVVFPDMTIVCFGFEGAAGERIATFDRHGTVCTKRVDDAGLVRRDAVPYSIGTSQVCASFSPDSELLAFVHVSRGRLVVIDRTQEEGNVTINQTKLWWSAGNLDANSKIKFSEDGRRIGVAGTLKGLEMWQVSKE